MPAPVQAALLGIVQGLTEFLPVSSSAHLILARMFFGFDAEKFGLPFDVAIHMGTLAAVVAYFWDDVLAMVRSVPEVLRPGGATAGERVPAGPLGGRQRTEGARLVWLIVTGTIPAVVVGLLFSDAIERHLRTPQIAAAALALGGLALVAAERAGSKRRDEHSLTLTEAFWIGCAQATALVPGVSRSGITMTLALLFGLRRAEAARFTFLLGITAILGAAAFKFPDMLAQGLDGDGAVLFAVGTASSAVVGYLAVKYFIRFVARHTLDLFAWYRLALAAAVVAWSWRT